MKELKKFVKKKKIGKYLEDFSLKSFNTYQINCKVKLLVYPNDYECLILLLNYIEKNKIKYMILGRGSNVIFASPIYDGVIIKLDCFKGLEVINNSVRVGAGYPLMLLAMKTAKLGLSGLEFASGIPGNVGGAVYMNAGAYKSDISEVLKEVKVITPDFKIKTLTNKELNFSYRSSLLKENKKYVCLEATFNLTEKNVDEIMAVIERRKQKREETQPLNYPSAGSVFRNPEGMFAGKLIEDLDLKGLSINGAEISTLHANFIINKKKATGEDIVSLINLIKDKVKEKYNIDLILEQEIIR